jgi:hypothetical protein
MLRDAAPERVEDPRARTEGAAPQHEGRRGHAVCRNEAAMRARTADVARTNLHVWSAAVHCFGIVIYNENRNPNV